LLAGINWYNIIFKTHIMKTFNSVKIVSLFVATMMMSSCGGSEEPTVSPLDGVIKEIPADRPFMVVLNDVESSGIFFKEYFHQYKIIEEKTKDKPEARITAWQRVSEAEYNEHKEHMGMELAHRGEDGKLVKEVSPPGYNLYIGNPKFGQWKEVEGTNRWTFFEQYLFMSTMFNLINYPVTRAFYSDYRTNYYGTGRVFYGTSWNGGRYYGTGTTFGNNYSGRSGSGYSSRSSSGSTSGSSFDDRVGSRTTRSTSRYGSSTRSSGGGYGK